MTKKEKKTDKYIISKSEIEEMAGLEKTHFLNENAKRVNKSLGDLTGLTGLGFHIIEVPVGCFSTEHHKHYFEDECVYILEGSATAFIGDESFTVGPGDFIGYPAGGEAHHLVNDGDETLKAIVVGQRLDHDVADYPLLNKRIYRNKGQAWDLVNLDDLEHPVAGKK
ncbi:MAG: cupin domain-containing protein [Rhizobiales bacterium]|nr:cupin domain-containing protein [Hyphomicrobiales bacterium]